jgi:hypothetical protein
MFIHHIGLFICTFTSQALGLGANDKFEFTLGPMRFCHNWKGMSLIALKRIFFQNFLSLKPWKMIPLEPTAQMVH